MKDPGRNRDERAHDRCDPAEEHRPVLPALEPTLGLDEIRFLQVEPAAVALEERTAPVHSDPPAPDRSDRVPDRAGEGDREVRGKARLQLPPEDDDALAGERAGSDRTAVDHHRLARRGEHGIDRHQQEDRIEAVVADDRGEGIGDPAQDRSDKHEPGLYPDEAGGLGLFFGGSGAARVTRKAWVVSSTTPSSLVARNRIL